MTKFGHTNIVNLGQMATPKLAFDLIPMVDPIRMKNPIPMVDPAPPYSKPLAIAFAVGL